MFSTTHIENKKKNGNITGKHVKVHLLIKLNTEL